MLVAHIVPGYFAAAKSQSHWKPEWGRGQRALLWATALASTVVPDLDVVYNALFRGFFNHSTLWTHSLFVYLGIGLLWWVLRHVERCSYLRTLMGLVAVGGLSHLALDVIAHGTPLLYPVSMVMIGIAPARVVEGGVWAYVTDPIFLLEPLAMTLAFVHGALSRETTSRFRRFAVTAAIGILILFVVVFLSSLPDLQKVVAAGQLRS
jgi:hypothetical protein